MVKKPPKSVFWLILVVLTYPHPLGNHLHHIQIVVDMFLQHSLPFMTFSKFGSLENNHRNQQHSLPFLILSKFGSFKNNHRDQLGQIACTTTSKQISNRSRDKFVKYSFRLSKVAEDYRAGLIPSLPFK